MEFLCCYFVPLVMILVGAGMSIAMPWHTNVGIGSTAWTADIAGMFFKSKANPGSGETKIPPFVLLLIGIVLAIAICIVIIFANFSPTVRNIVCGALSVIAVAFYATLVIKQYRRNSKYR